MEDLLVNAPNIPNRPNKIPVFAIICLDMTLSHNLVYAIWLREISRSKMLIWGHARSAPKVVSVMKKDVTVV